MEDKLMPSVSLIDELQTKWSNLDIEKMKKYINICIDTGGYGFHGYILNGKLQYICHAGPQYIKWDANMQLIYSDVTATKLVKITDSLVSQFGK